MAALRGIPPISVKSIPAAEAWAISVVLRATPARRQLFTDCKANLAVLARGKQWATSGKRASASIWRSIFSALDEDPDSIQNIKWIPAHKSRSMIGVAEKSDGVPINVVDWMANMAADELAKSAANLVRVPADVRQKLISVETAAAFWRCTLGETTFKSQNVVSTVVDEEGNAKQVTLRDSDGKPSGNAKGAGAADAPSESDSTPIQRDDQPTLTTVVSSEPASRMPHNHTGQISVDLALLQLRNDEKRKAVALSRRYPEPQASLAAPQQQRQPEQQRRSRNDRAKIAANPRGPCGAAVPSDVVNTSEIAARLESCDSIALCTAQLGISARDTCEQHELRNAKAAQLCRTAAEHSISTSASAQQPPQQFCIHSGDEADGFSKYSSRADFLKALRGQAKPTTKEPALPNTSRRPPLTSTSSSRYNPSRPLRGTQSELSNSSVNYTHGNPIRAVYSGVKASILRLLQAPPPPAARRD